MPKNKSTFISQETRNRLVLKYYKLVYKWVGEFINKDALIQRLSMDDAFQYAMIAFMRALERCDGTIVETGNDIGFVSNDKHHLSQQYAFFRKSIFLSLKRIAIYSRIIVVPSCALKRMKDGEEQYAGEVGLLTDLQIEDVVDSYEDNLEENTDLLREMLSLLTDEDRELVCSYYGLFGREPMTKTALAVQTGISRHTIGIRIRKACEKMKNHVREHTYV